MLKPALAIRLPGLFEIPIQRQRNQRRIHAPQGSCAGGRAPAGTFRDFTRSLCVRIQMLRVAHLKTQKRSTAAMNSEPPGDFPGTAGSAVGCRRSETTWSTVQAVRAA
jgi:hypothetical protein